jgi:hypothetical protein
MLLADPHRHSLGAAFSSDDRVFSNHFYQPVNCCQSCFEIEFCDGQNHFKRGERLTLLGILRLPGVETRSKVRQPAQLPRNPHQVNRGRNQLPARLLHASAGRFCRVERRLR